MKDKRKSHRFNLDCPVSIHNEVNGSSIGRTQNISSSGVLLTANAAFNPGRRVQYQITLAEIDEQRVELKCIGRVMRLEPVLQLGRQDFSLAVTLDRYEFRRQDLSQEGSEAAAGENARSAYTIDVR